MPDRQMKVQPRGTGQPHYELLQAAMVAAGRKTSPPPGNFLTFSYKVSSVFQK